MTSLKQKVFKIGTKLLLQNRTLYSYTHISTTMLLLLKRLNTTSEMQWPFLHSLLIILKGKKSLFWWHEWIQLPIMLFLNLRRLTWLFAHISQCFQIIDERLLTKREIQSTAEWDKPVLDVYRNKRDNVQQAHRDYQLTCYHLERFANCKRISKYNKHRSFQLAWYLSIDSLCSKM